MKRDIKNYVFFKKICALPCVTAIYLFGSRAKKINQERSDIDLAIDCTGATKEQWRDIIRIVEDNSDTLLTIDCIRLDTLRDEHLLASINDHKVLLYKKELPI